MIIFAKAPLPGRVKTRLCPPLAPDEAATLHSTMVLDTLETSRNLPGFDRFLACSPSRQHPFFKAVGARQGILLLDQHSGDLGARMDQAFFEVFKAGYGSAVIVGSDLPTLTSSLLRQARQGLADHDIVLGPSLDGGYYLIGLRKPTPELFMDIPWSTDRVLACTQEKVQRLGQSLNLLPTARDLDTLDDLHYYMAKIQQSGKKILSPRTTQVLKTLEKRLLSRE